MIIISQARVYFLCMSCIYRKLQHSSYIPTTTSPKMPPSETTNLLPPTGGVGGRSRPVKFAPLKSSRHLLLGSWINLLLVAVPLSFIGASRMSRLMTIRLMISRGSSLECRRSIQRLIHRHCPPCKGRHRLNHSFTYLTDN